MAHESTAGRVTQESERANSIAMLRHLRREARQEISRLIQFLDDSDDYVLTELEDDSELEDIGDAEPNLGSFDGMFNQEKSYRQRACLAGVDLEADDADLEPSLGATETHPTVPWSGHANWNVQRLDLSGDQRYWGAGVKDDREDDAGDNPEEDPAERGIADEDGLAEQIYLGHRGVL